MSRFLTLVILAVGLVAGEPRVRPSAWAQPIIDAHLENWYQVADGIYRSAQPERADMLELERFGVREILNLRDLHTDDDEAKGTKLVLHRVEMEADSITVEQLVQAVKAIQVRKGPILVHCWHGSDRTGATIATWRIVGQGWTKEAAIDEMLHGGYGFHGVYQASIVNLIRGLEVADLRKKAGIPEPAPAK